MESRVPDSKSGSPTCLGRALVPQLATGLALAPRHRPAHRPPSPAQVGPADGEEGGLRGRFQASPGPDRAFRWPGRGLYQRPIVP